MIENDWYNVWYHQVSTYNDTATDGQEQYTKLTSIEEQLSRMIQILNSTQRSGGALSDHLPRDCSDVQRAGSNISGIYTVYPDDGREPIAVFCDMETDGGGWTVRNVSQFITDISDGISD